MQNHLCWRLKHSHVIKLICGVYDLSWILPGTTFRNFVYDSEILFMILCENVLCTRFMPMTTEVQDRAGGDPHVSRRRQQNWHFRGKKTHQKWYGKLSWHFLFTVKLIWTFPHCILAIHCCSNCVSLLEWIITIGPSRLVSLRNIFFLNLSIPSYRNSKGTLLPFSLINHHLSHRSHVVSTNKCT